MSCKAIHALERAGAAKARSSVQAQTAGILQMIKLKSKLTARPTIRRRHTSMQVRILRRNLTGHVWYTFAAMRLYNIFSSTGGMYQLPQHAFSLRASTGDNATLRAIYVGLPGATDLALRCQTNMQSRGVSLSLPPDSTI